MAIQNQSFTQLIRLMDPINQRRITQNKRILWPDYEVLNIINNFSIASQTKQSSLDLSNLFMYCSFEQNFCVKKTNKNDYLDLKECYQNDMTHMAIWVCMKSEKQNSQEFGCSLPKISNQNSKAWQNTRSNSLKKMQKTTSIKNISEQIYVIISKRVIVIDQVIKTTHKISVSIIPLSSQKFLWGGCLNFQQFQSISHQIKEDQGLFKQNGQNFGFKIQTKPIQSSGIFRKSNGMMDKRHLRFSNYYNSKKQHQQNQSQNQKSSKQVKQVLNLVKLSPKNIRQHKQFLYIQLDLTNNSHLPQNKNQYNFVSLVIYGRHKKPIYGGAYQNNSSESENDSDYNSQNESKFKKFKKYIKEEIFSIYSMPFMVFNSYLQSQLNFSENQDLREINFRGSCQMFSALKKLQIKSSQKKQKPKQKQSLQSQQEILKKKIQCFKSPQNKSYFRQKPIETELNMRKDMLGCKQYNCQKNQLRSYQKIQIIQIKPQKQLFTRNNKGQIKKLSLIDIKIEFIKILLQKIGQKSSHEITEDLIYIPVVNPKGFQPLRIGVKRYLIEAFNKSIMHETTIVQIQSYQLEDPTKHKNQDIEIDVSFKRKRQTIYTSRKNHNLITQTKGPKYVRISVFLAQKVYKQESVQFLIDLLQLLEQVNTRLKEENNYQFSLQFSQSLKKLFEQLNSIQNIENTLTLLKDLSIGADIKPLIMIWIFQEMKTFSDTKIQQIQKIQQLTSIILIKQNNKQSENQNESQIIKQIITLIKEYHKQFQHQQQLEHSGNLGKQFTVRLFILFLESEFINENDESCLKIISDNLCGKKCQNQGISTNLFKILEGITKQFFMINSRYILNNCKKELWNILDKIELINDKASSSQEQQANTNKQIQIDKAPQKSLDNKASRANIIPNSLNLIRILKKSIEYSIQKIKQIGINVFLSQPQQEFQQQQFWNEDQVQQILTVSHLKRFIRKYFIFNHSNILQSSRNQHQQNNCTDSSYMNLTVDLLEIYIKAHNTEQSILLNLNFNSHINNTKDNNKANRKVNNIIELMNLEYEKWTIKCYSNQQKSSYQRSSQYQQRRNQYQQRRNQHLQTSNQYQRRQYEKQSQSLKVNVNYKNQYNYNFKQQDAISFKLNQVQQSIKYQRYKSSNSQNVNLNDLKEELSLFETKFILVKNNQMTANQGGIKPKKDLKKKNNEDKEQPNNNKLQFGNAKGQLMLGDGHNQKIFDFTLNLQNEQNESRKQSQQLKQPECIKQSKQAKFIKPSITISPHLQQFQNSYAINLLNNQLNLNAFNHSSKRFRGQIGNTQSNNQSNNPHQNAQNSQNHQNTLISCYFVYVQLEIVLNNQVNNNKENQNQRENVLQQRIIFFQGSSILFYQNFNHQTSFQTNAINLTLAKHKSSQFLLPSHHEISNISKVNLKIYSKKLPILQSSFSFINARLDKYLKTLSNKSSTKKGSNRKTIGGRFTQYLSKRKSVHFIEQNMTFQKGQNKRSSLSENQQSISCTQSTLYNLPQVLLLHLLKVDKCYIQDEERLLHFIDQYYQKKQPKYNDYILYLAIRPNFIKLSSIFQHYFGNKYKYQDSKVLQSLIKLKMNKHSNEDDLMMKLFNKKPRILSELPLKSIKNTIQERQLLARYMKQGIKVKSKGNNGKSIEKSFLNSKTTNEDRSKLQSKQIQI